MKMPSYKENTNSQSYKVSASLNLKWRYKTTTTYYPAGNNHRIKSISGIFSPGSPRPGEERESEGNWIEGGIAEPSNRFCKGTTASLIDEVFLYKTPTPIDIGEGLFYYAWFAKDVATTTVLDIEVDWQDFADKLRSLKPLNQNLSVVGMGGSGDDGVDMVGGGIVSGQFLTNLYQNNSDTNLAPLFPGITPTSWGKPAEVKDSTTPDDGADYDETTGGEPSNYPTNNTQTNVGICNIITSAINMTVTVYLGDKEDEDEEEYKDPEQGLVANKDDFLGGSSGNVGNVTDWGDSTGFTGEEVTTDKGSTSGSGLNLVELLNGNSVFPFDSVYFSTEDYNNFVDAGGGLVGESGIFPTASNIWIEEISLNVTGNNMTICQNTDFDDTPLLTVGERIFGYIINQSGDYQPSFAGWVTSMKKVMNGKAEKIVYSCKCLKYFLDQLYTPSYYKYVPSETNTASNLNIDVIIKKMLVRTGITIADIDLASINAPAITWNFESMRNVLNWGQSFLGKHVYFIDKNGILNFKATDSGSFIKNFAIPTRGASITASNKVLNFTPLTDFSRSRSKIILVGDFPLVELSGERTFVYPYGEDPSDYVNPQDVTVTGVYQYKNFYNSTIYYLMWKSDKTLVNELISDPSKAAEFIKISDNYSQAPGVYDSTDKGIALEIATFNTDINNSFIYIWRMMFPGARSTQLNWKHGNIITRPYSTTISYRYVVKDNEPLSVIINTGLLGGTEVIKRPEFKKVTSDTYSSDDTALMQQYANTIKDFYKPIYGGNLVIDGLDIDVELLGKVSVTNTSLPAEESENLFIYGIRYDCVNQKTYLDISNKTYLTLPYFSKQEELTLNKSRDEKTLDDVAQESIWTVPKH